MNADKIKRALSEVHLTERSSERPDGVDRETAAAAAAKAHGLTADETEVLFNALHVSIDASRVAGVAVEKAIAESRADRKVAVLACKGDPTFYRAACALLSPVAEYRERRGFGRVYGVIGDFAVEVQP